jgi:hypothetical protein
VAVTAFVICPGCKARKISVAVARPPLPGAEVTSDYVALIEAKTLAGRRAHEGDSWGQGINDLHAEAGAGPRFVTVME